MNEESESGEDNDDDNNNDDNDAYDNNAIKKMLRFDARQRNFLS